MGRAGSASPRGSVTMDESERTEGEPEAAHEPPKAANEGGGTPPPPQSPGGGGDFDPNRRRGRRGRRGRGGGGFTGQRPQFGAPRPQFGATASRPASSVRMSGVRRSASAVASLGCAAVRHRAEPAVGGAHAAGSRATRRRSAASPRARAPRRRRMLRPASPSPVRTRSSKRSARGATYDGSTSRRTAAFGRAP